MKINENKSKTFSINNTINVIFEIKLDMSIFVFLPTVIFFKFNTLGTYRDITIAWLIFGITLRIN